MTTLRDIIRLARPAGAAPGGCGSCGGRARCAWRVWRVIGGDAECWRPQAEPGPCRARGCAGFREAADPPTGRLLFLCRPEYRESPNRAFMQSLMAAGWRVASATVAARKPPVCEFACRLDELKAVVDRAAPLDATIRWEEHSRLFSNGTWKQFCAWSYTRGVAPLQVDYGYLAHYKTFIVDRYTPGGLSAITEDWRGVPTEPQWHTAPAYFADYRWRALEAARAALAAGPLVDPPYVAVWPSFSANLARPPFRSKRARKDAWLAAVCAHLTRRGFRVVVKQGPVGGPKTPDGLTEFRGKDPVENARVAHWATNNIVLNSSVTNELLLWGLPVTCLGLSWWSGLGVFHEPETWDELGPPAPVDPRARQRLVNWWLGHSGDFASAPALLAGRLADFRAATPPAGEQAVASEIAVDEMPLVLERI